jgi:hypothetical protein
MDATFSEPVFARVARSDGRSELLEIRTAREGISAIHRNGLGGYRFEMLEWQIATDRLIQAALHPSPERAEKAREALLALASVPGDAALDS